jgi:hypothetical protein
MNFAVPVRLHGVGRKVFRHQHWRKSSQWVALVRSHAELVALERDLLLDALFTYPRGQEIKRRRCAWDPFMRGQAQGQAWGQGLGLW